MPATQRPTLALLVLHALASAATASSIREDAVVRVQLRELPVQVQNGAYQVLSRDVFIRRIIRVGVYFMLQRSPTEASTWQLEGFQCGAELPTTTHDSGVCTKFMASKLSLFGDASNGDALPAPLVFQQPLREGDAHAKRQLQFTNPDAPVPPTFDDGTVAYYGCSYGSWDQWCCAESNTGASGTKCWDISSGGQCSEEPSPWSGENLICCSDNFNECTPTYEPPMPTPPPTPAPSSAKPSPVPTSTPAAASPVP
ncbi:hypothetical protein PybrP1_009771, partial [[Pythium] brassicae (nom. inval.)]